ncbi:hypothetical protein V8C86DRAFT_3099630 [Haematococcus lacustris]
MAAVRSPAVSAEWSPDGRQLLIATTAPRLRVDNKTCVLDYQGVQDIDISTTCRDYMSNGDAITMAEAELAALDLEVPRSPSGAGHLPLLSLCKVVALRTPVALVARVVVVQPSAVVWPAPLAVVTVSGRATRAGAVVPGAVAPAGSAGMEALGVLVALVVLAVLAVLEVLGVLVGRVGQAVLVVRGALAARMEEPGVATAWMVLPAGLNHRQKSKQAGQLTNAPGLVAVARAVRGRGRAKSGGVDDRSQIQVMRKHVARNIHAVYGTSLGTAGRGAGPSSGHRGGRGGGRHGSSGRDHNGNGKRPAGHQGGRDAKGPVKCYNCNGLGHIARDCPSPPQQGGAGGSGGAGAGGSGVRANA